MSMSMISMKQIKEGDGLENTSVLTFQGFVSLHAMNIEPTFAISFEIILTSFCLKLVYPVCRDR